MFTLSDTRPSRGFTLTEILVVLVLLGLTFSALLLLLRRGVDASAGVTGYSENLVSEASLFWDLQRKVFGARKIKVEGNSLYMITTGGSLYPGVVKSAYLFRDGILLYYEFPYAYGALEEVEEDKLQEVGRFEEFSVSVLEGRRELTRYEGFPPYVKVRVNGREFLFETFALRTSAPSELRKP